LDTLDATANEIARVTSLLHRNLSDPWQRFPILIERGRITNNKDLGIILNGKIASNTHAPRGVGFGSEPLACGRRSNTGSPDYSLAKNALSSDHDSLFINQLDTVPEPDIDT
jgi:hypothetical protein